MTFVYLVMGAFSFGLGAFFAFEHGGLYRALRAYGGKPKWSVDDTVFSACWVLLLAMSSYLLSRIG